PAPRGLPRGHPAPPGRESLRASLRHDVEQPAREVDRLADGPALEMRPYPGVLARPGDRLLLRERRRHAQMAPQPPVDLHDDLHRLLLEPERIRLGPRLPPGKTGTSQTTPDLLADVRRERLEKKHERPGGLLEAGLVTVARRGAELVHGIEELHEGRHRGVQ